MSDNDRYVAKWYEPREYPKELTESKLYKRFIKTQNILKKRKNEVSGYDPLLDKLKKKSLEAYIEQ